MCNIAGDEEAEAKGEQKKINESSDHVVKWRESVFIRSSKG